MLVDILSGRSESAVKSSESGNGTTIIGEVVTTDGSGDCVDDEPGVVPLIFDDQIGFISC